MGLQEPKRETKHEKDESEAKGKRLDELVEEPGGDAADYEAKPVEGEGYADDIDDDIVSSLKVRPGHINEMTIVCIGIGWKDKAQPLVVSPSSCADRGKSPEKGVRGDHMRFAARASWAAASSCEG